ncbi:hypothetical protein HBI56_234260 [Parastagonospora nodorum]|nr:hypothetical protein HBI10_234830 [Parastagonospora nodorum]KAH4008906.1 hypothetical protein HBI13_228020 [Parastagonospora nodorum]KAH4185764.1 hypothetical protein HBH42_176460 [Parastagonospora nodorum]KAH4903026.1 hypothetical protein HBH74_182200 [Parastagonospora nodorum]KAH4945664.1 hypothetical protein HBH73_144340 [Parastagonospora nodorum]
MSHWPNGTYGPVSCVGEHAEEDADVITSVEDWTAGLDDDKIMRPLLGDAVGDDVGAELDGDGGTGVELAEANLSELIDKAMDADEATVENTALKLISDVAGDDIACEEFWLDEEGLVSQVPKPAWHPVPQ